MIIATEVTGPLLGWWVAALVVGLVVAVVVTVLLQWLLTRVREIEEGAEAVWKVGKEVARNTATTWMLGQTADIVEEIRDEAMRHDALLRSKGRDVLEFLIVLTVAEIALVLVVLATYLALVRRSLRRSAETLAKVGFGVRAIETQAGAIGPSVVRINAALEEIAAAAPGLVERVDRLARP